MHDAPEHDRKPNPLKAYREKHRLTQQAIADRLEVSRSLIGKLETGEKSFTLDMILLVEARLGIDRDEFLPPKKALEPAAARA